jgi:hypothetical protein
MLSVFNRIREWEVGMAKVYVHIESVVKPDGKEAKSALKPAIIKQLTTALAKDIKGGVPKKPFTLTDKPKPKPKPEDEAKAKKKKTKAKAKPKPKGKKLPNALKARATLSLKLVADKGKRKMFAKVQFTGEALVWPKTSGFIVATSSGTGNIDQIGPGDKQVEGAAKDLSYALVPGLTKKSLTSETFKKSAAGAGLEIEWK